MGVFKRNFKIVFEVVVLVVLIVMVFIVVYKIIEQVVEYIGKVRVEVKFLFKFVGFGVVGFVEGCMIELIVGGVLLIVFEDFVGFIDFFEVYFSFVIVWIMVWMVFYGQFLECIFQLFWFGILVNVKCFVVIMFCYFFLCVLIEVFCLF